MFEFFLYEKNDTYALFEKKDLNIRKELDKRLFIQKLTWYLILLINICCVYNINSIILRFSVKGEFFVLGFTILSSLILIINLFEIIKRSMYLYKVKIELGEGEEDGIKFVYSKLMFKKWYIFVYQSIVLSSTILNLTQIISQKAYLNILIILSFLEIGKLLLKLLINKFRILMIRSSLESIIEDSKEDKSEEYLEDAKEIEFLLGTRFVVITRQLKRLIDKLEYTTNKEQSSIYSKSQLVTNLSHDLKTPLTSIMNSIYILKNEELEEDEKIEQIKILKSKSYRLKTLIDNLNEVINCEEDEIILNKEDINLYELLNQCVNSFELKIKEANLHLRFNIDNKNTIVLVDKDKIIRVFENLLSNIVKYSLEDTRVYINIKNEKESTNITFKNICKYELEVSENILGSRFVKGDKSRNSKGYGLGLNIVKNLIRTHGGKVNISSEGDLFKVELNIKNSKKTITEK
ncbi:MAG: HAMP domain-containing sensor histidine kinase [Romboutsia sp.]